MRMKFGKPALLRASVVLWALLFVAWSCSGDPTQNGQADATGCTDDEDCQNGTCVGGQCVTFWQDGDLVADNGPEIPADRTTQPEDSRSTPDDADSPEDLPEQPEDATQPDQTVEGIPNIVVDPLQHTFTFMPGVVNPETKAVTILNDGKKSLVIEKMEWKEGSSPEFTFMALPPLPKKLNPYGQTSVTVVFKEKAPHVPGTLQIHSTDPDEPVVEVVFKSQSKTGDQPCIQISPASLNFGQVVRGTSKALPFDVVNCSEKLPVTVTDIKRSKFFGMPLTDEYQIEPAPQPPIPLAGNQAISFDMVYTPGLAGIDSGYFTFVNTDPATPEAKLDVYGVGIPPPLEDIGLHIELEWDQDDCDVDLHLVKPGGKLFDCKDDCYYANMNPDWGAPNDFIDDPFLDYDDVDGYGPENLNVSEPVPGTYKVTMHYYSDSYEGWGGSSTKATVRIYSYGNLLGEFGPKMLEYTDKTWDVCNFDWPGANVTVLDTIYMAPAQPVCFNW